MDIFLSRRDENCKKFLRLFLHIQDKLLKYKVDVALVEIEKLEPRKISVIKQHIMEGLPFATVQNHKTGRRQVIKNPKQIYEVLLEIYLGKKKLRAEMNNNGNAKIPKNVFHDGFDLGLYTNDIDMKKIQRDHENRPVFTQEFEDSDDSVLMEAMASKISAKRSEYKPVAGPRLDPAQTEELLDDLASKKWDETDHDYIDVSDFTKSAIEAGELDNFRNVGEDRQTVMPIMADRYQNDRYQDYRKNYDMYAGY